MVSFAGGMGGAMSGAKFGSMFGPWGTGIGAVAGGIGGLFGGGKSDMEKLAELDLKNRINRSNEAWRLARGDYSRAQNYFAPIAGGSREAALTAAAPEIRGAQERMDKGRQTMFDLSARSGGGGAMIDPYARSRVATDILTTQRPQAAKSMADLAATAGGWAQGMGQGAAQTIFTNERLRREEERKTGAGLFDLMERTMPLIKDQLGGLFKKQQDPFQGAITNLKGMQGYRASGMPGVPAQPWTF